MTAVQESTRHEVLLDNFRTVLEDVAREYNPYVEYDPSVRDLADRIVEAGRPLIDQVVGLSGHSSCQRISEESTSEFKVIQGELSVAPARYVLLGFDSKRDQTLAWLGKQAGGYGPHSYGVNVFNLRLASEDDIEESKRRILDLRTRRQSNPDLSE